MIRFVKWVPVRNQENTLIKYLFLRISTSKGFLYFKKMVLGFEPSLRLVTTNPVYHHLQYNTSGIQIFLEIIQMPGKYDWLIINTN